MPATVKCSRCQASIEVADADLAGRIHCSNCSAIFAPPASPVQGIVAGLPTDGAAISQGILPSPAPQYKFEEDDSLPFPPRREQFDHSWWQVGRGLQALLLSIVLSGIALVLYSIADAIFQLPARGIPDSYGALVWMGVILGVVLTAVALYLYGIVSCFTARKFSGWIAGHLFFLIAVALLMFFQRKLLQSVFSPRPALVIVTTYVASFASFGCMAACLWKVGRRFGNRSLSAACVVFVIFQLAISVTTSAVAVSALRTPRDGQLANGPDTAVRLSLVFAGESGVSSIWCLIMLYIAADSIHRGTVAAITRPGIHMDVPLPVPVDRPAVVNPLTDIDAGLPAGNPAAASRRDWNTVQDGLNLMFFGFLFTVAGTVGISWLVPQSRGIEELGIRAASFIAVAVLSGFAIFLCLMGGMLAYLVGTCRCIFAPRFGRWMFGHMLWGISVLGFNVIIVAEDHKKFAGRFEIILWLCATFVGTLSLIMFLQRVAGYFGDRRLVIGCRCVLGLQGTLFGLLVWLAGSATGNEPFWEIQARFSPLLVLAIALASLAWLLFSTRKSIRRSFAANQKS